MTTFGIDLGTTYSCIAHVDEYGKPVVIKTRNNDDTLPSVVYFESPDNVVVGQTAKDSMLLAPDLVVSLIKRQMGEQVTYDFNGKSYSPASISSLILRELAAAAGEHLDEAVSHVVITVPAYFGQSERQATTDAGKLADLDVLQLIPEPVAAAMYYESLTEGQRGDRTVFVFDLGGGTLDTTVVQFAGNDITVVCTDGDHRLGGADWDAAITSYLIRRLEEERPDVDMGDETLMQDLASGAEKLKKDLSSAQSRSFTARPGGPPVKIELTREDFEGFTADLLERALDIAERTLDQASARGIDTYDEVLFVGGSTRMPAVAERFVERFGARVQATPRITDPDLAVAKGAALAARYEDVRQRISAGEGAASEEAIAEISDELNVERSAISAMVQRQVTYVAPRSIGVKLVESDAPDAEFYVEHLLHANTPLPSEPHAQQFATVYEGQTGIEVEIWEQDSEVATRDLGSNKRIAQGLINDLPPMRKGSPFNVEVSMDAGGTLRLHAVEPSTGKDLHIEVVVEGLSAQQLDEQHAIVGGLSVGH